MKEYSLIENFFMSIHDKPLIGASHVCLYMSLLSCYVKNDFQNPIKISRANVMKIAKIGGIATYHKCMKDLVASGYIRYQPSFHPGLSSLVEVRPIVNIRN